MLRSLNLQKSKNARSAAAAAPARRALSSFLVPADFSITALCNIYKYRNENIIMYNSSLQLIKNHKA